MSSALSFEGAFLMLMSKSRFSQVVDLNLQGGTMYIYIHTLSINGGIAIAFFIIAWWWYKNKQQPQPLWGFFQFPLNTVYSINILWPITNQPKILYLLFFLLFRKSIQFQIRIFLPIFFCYFQLQISFKFFIFFSSKCKYSFFST